MSRSVASLNASPNFLLRALPSREYKRLVSHLEPVELSFKAILYESDQPITHLYFPTCGMLSLLSPRAAREGGMEVAVVGREGVLGLPLLLGTGRSIAQSMVQVPGEALRLPANKVHALVGCDSKLHALLLRYLHSFLIQLVHGVACNAMHSVEKRLCRWLLVVHDRASSDHLPLTHEFLAAMLGVRRASVTEAARRVRQAGLIRYGRGQLTVLNRSGLEKASCGCYHAVNRELRRMLH